MIYLSRTTTPFLQMAGAIAAFVLTLSPPSGFAPISPAATPETKESEIPRAEHVRIYLKTRETLDRWEDVLRLPKDEREAARIELNRQLRLIDPEQLAGQAELIPLAKLLEVIAKNWPDQLAQTTSFKATREGALWMIHLRDTRLVPPGSLGDDLLMILYLDGYSGTVLFPLHTL